MATKRAKKRTATKGPDVLVKRSAKSVVPKLIYANASPRSVSGVSMFEAGNRINSETAANFGSEAEDITRAVNRLQDVGFQVLQASWMTINIAGSQSTYERAFNTTLFADERPVIKPGGVNDTGTFIDCADTEMSGLISTAGSTMADLVEGVAIEEPRYPMAASRFAPHKASWHLDVPAGVSLGCNADRAHRSGITGRGVKVAMVDSGWFKQAASTVSSTPTVACLTCRVLWG